MVLFYLKCYINTQREGEGKDLYVIASGLPVSQNVHASGPPMYSYYGGTLDLGHLGRRHTYEEELVYYSKIL